jgi:Zn-dependent peptidase ImmA (M78 family)
MNPDPRSKLPQDPRDILLLLWTKRREESGGLLSADGFFPVDVRAIVKSVLGWQLLEVSDLGATEYGERITGRCLFDKRLIELATGESREEQVRYTMAHEVGHAVLHRAQSICTGLQRKPRPVRKIQHVVTPPVERKVEREANLFAGELLMPKKAVEYQFFKLFRCGALRLGSSKVAQILGASWDLPSRIGTELPDLRALSESLATYEPEDNHTKSLIRYFGVSKSAMGVRLRELGLVFQAPDILRSEVA